jgi:hypothetical protein
VIAEIAVIPPQKAKSGLSGDPGHRRNRKKQKLTADEEGSFWLLAFGFLIRVIRGDPGATASRGLKLLEKGLAFLVEIP